MPASRRRRIDRARSARLQKLRHMPQLSADIIARIDAVLKRKNMTQRDLAKKKGRSEAVISRWTSGFSNLTLKSIAEISTALGETLVRVAE